MRRIKRTTNQQRVIEAMQEILTNPETPVGLWNNVSKFITDQSNEFPEEFYQTTAYLTDIMKSVPPDERVGADQVEREAREMQDSVN